MIYKSTIQLLRVPFSINLLPIFLFAVLNSNGSINLVKCLLVFFVVHLLFYPASNAYNSYMDKDEGSIGGVKNPLKPTRQLFHASVLLDVLGLLLSLFVGIYFTLINLILVLLSRAYSYDKIRLKKFAVVSFALVSLTQGGLSYLNMINGIQSVSDLTFFHPNYLLQAIAASLFVGAIYPITQIYQHEEDHAHGDRTISMLLGYKGTFIFSGLLFLFANIIIAYLLNIRGLIIFQAFMLFPIIFFGNWARKSWNNFHHINFRNTMIMAMSSAVAMNLAFLVLIVLQYFR